MRIVLLLTLVLGLNGIFSLLNNLPQEVGADVPEGKLNSLSFAPFREGQSPLEAIFPTVDQIEADLTLLAAKTHTIRTYASGEGTMKAIPALAQKQGLKMIQGAWIGYMDVDNRKEIDALIEAANTYPEVIKRVIVGNEVLLRGEQEPEKLIEYIREVKRSVKQPVSYADVWSMYMKYPQLIREVDFITIHILPYWEDEPIPVTMAPAHIERIYKQVQHEAESIAPGKPILIGESGWPSAGKQRGWAKPSVVNEARFIRGLIKVAQDNHFDYNIVEAFNQPWKSELEGIVGANWGLFSVDRQEVFPLTGKVYENAKWLKELLVSSLIFVLVVAFFARKLQSLSTLRMALFLVFVQLLIALLVNQTDKSWYTSYNDWQRCLAALVAGLNIFLAGLAMPRAYNLLAEQIVNRKVVSGIQSIIVFVATVAIYISYQLALNGRYISFPFALTHISVASLSGLTVMGWLVAKRWSFRLVEFNQLIGYVGSGRSSYKVWGYGLVLIGILLIGGEVRAFTIGRDFILAYPEIGKRIYWAFIFTITNTQLLEWLFGLLVLAIPMVLSGCKNCREAAV
ncbi:MAG: exo-beta-1,3-glucanase [Methylococcaceae bacterium]|nr:exo-beta-1,3-glucanase [Methylococcaceae bacterium]